MRKKSHLLYVAIALCLIAFMGLVCVGSLLTRSEKAEGSISEALTETSDERSLPRRDLDEIRASGVLRVLVPARAEPDHLPRNRTAEPDELALAREFADLLGLRLQLVRVERYADLVPALLNREGGMIAGDFAVTPERSADVAFTVPLIREPVHVVVSGDDGGIDSLASLSGGTLAVAGAPDLYAEVRRRVEQFPDIRLEAIPPGENGLTPLENLTTGRYDAVVAGRRAVTAFRDYGGDIRLAFKLHERQVAWAVRMTSPKLLAAANRFIRNMRIAAPDNGIHTGDWPEIKARGVLRVLTRNNATCYFIWRGQLMGFEYELMKEFARRHGLRLEMRVPPDWNTLFQWLREGRGDVIAAAVTRNAERGAVEGVRFTRPYNRVPEMLVSRSTGDRIDTMADLRGRTIVARRSSSYWKTLQALRTTGAPFQLHAAPEDMETEEIIARVGFGEYDLTVADGHILNVEMAWRDDVKGVFPVGEPAEHGWAVRPGNPELLRMLNRFIEAEYRGVFYNTVFNRYFKDPADIRSHAEFRAKHRGRLSPYDDLARKYAGRYNFDWRLIVAQMYQESRFDPKARSFGGAVGLMQMLPRTARSLGFTRLTHPETAIHAGVKYMDRLRSFLEPDLPMAERIAFLLAAYNAGPGHLRDARRLAREMEWDPNRWTDNVARAMMLLSKPEYAEKARYGYVRGHIPVNYVREIRQRYSAYLQATEGIAGL